MAVPMRMNRPASRPGSATGPCSTGPGFASSKSSRCAWLSVAAWPGAACLLIVAVFTVALTNGGPWVAVGFAGFIVWLVFVITARVSLLRDRPIP